MAVVGEIVVPDGAALEALFMRHRPVLVRRLALVVGDPEEAQDLVQRVYVRLIERWPLPDQEDLGRWLAVVGLRLAIDEVRRRRRWGFLPVRDSDATWALSVDPDLWRALAQLDRRTRAALVLTVIEGYSQEEAAAALAVPRGTLASWLSRAKDHLRTVLEVQDHD
jgi:RNA polymerase sigma factor (sigma-70 family)